MTGSTADWTGSSGGRKPQLPCGTNYGSHARYVIPAGTKIRIGQLPSCVWRTWITKRELKFDKARHGTKDKLCFDYEDWRIWVDRKKIETS